MIYKNLPLKQRLNPTIVADVILSHTLIFNYWLPYKIRNWLYTLRISLVSITQYPKPICDSAKFLSLKERGLLASPIIIPAAQAVELERKLMDIPHYEVMRNNVRVKKVWESKYLANDNQFLDLALNHELLRLAENYLGCPPVIQYLAAWEVTEATGTTNEMYFHMDHHGHRFLKFFVYLSDVEEGNGHHEYVEGTHRQAEFDNQVLNLKENIFLKTQVLSKRKYKGNFIMNSDAVVNSSLNVSKLIGQAGTCFIEDTRGLHRGTPFNCSVTKSRVVFQVLYTAYNNMKDVHEKSQNRVVFDEITAADSDIEKRSKMRACSQIINFKDK